MSASLTHIRPSNSLRSNYQTNRLHKIQISVTFFILISKKCLQKKELSVYIERKRIEHKKNQLMSYRLYHKLLF